MTIEIPSIEIPSTHEDISGNESFIVLEEYIKNARQMIEDEYAASKSYSNKNGWIQCFHSQISILRMHMDLAGSELKKYLGEEQFETIGKKIESILEAQHEVEASVGTGEVAESEKQRLLSMLDMCLE